MPLINTVPTDQVHVQVQHHDSVQQQETDPSFELFDDVDDEFLDSDMEGSILNRGRPTKRKTKPAIPQRSHKRTSMLLEGVMAELKSIDGKSAVQQLELSNPHELYLSSEEDASFSDDYDDTESLVDFGSSSELGGEANSPPSSRHSRASQEDTARMVSFTTVKPQIVNICIPSPTKSHRQTLSLDTSAPLRPAPLKLNSSSDIRRLSTSSTSSPPQSASASSPAPPRKSSRIASNISSLVSSTKHAFLASDPFQSSPDLDTEAEQTPTPKTPISMAAAAWKSSITRTLSKASRPSTQNLNRAYTSGIVMQHRDSSQMSLADLHGEDDHRRSRQRAATTPQVDSPVRSDSTAAPPFVKDRSYSLGMGMRGLARRKSVKGRSERYVG